MAIQYQFKTLTQWPKKRTAVRRRSPWRVGAVAVYRQLERELEHIGAKGTVYVEVAIDTRHIRRDGLPAATAPTPAFPGVVVYAPDTRKGAMRFMSDTYTDWMGNLRGISMTLTALRAVDRYGAVQDAEQYKGFAALPPPSDGRFGSIESAAEWMAEQLGTFTGGVISASQEDYRKAYRELAQRFHPDRDASKGRQWQQLQMAAELLNKHHGI
jgi:hypothetical protein